MASGGESNKKKSRILVVGGTGYIGRHVVAGSARLGHPTTALIRDLAPSSGAVEPARSIYGSKVAIRRAVEAAAIPHTYVACNYFAGFALPSIGQFMPKAAPVDSVVILGDGATKVVFVEEGDIGTYTVLAAVDPRAENKTVHIRPPANTLSHDELVTMWENKTGKKLERVYVPEDAVLNKIKELAYPMNILVSIAHAAYCRGEMSSPLDDPQDFICSFSFFSQCPLVCRSWIIFTVQFSSAVQLGSALICTAYLPCYKFMSSHARNIPSGAVPSCAATTLAPSSPNNGRQSRNQRRQYTTLKL